MKHAALLVPTLAIGLLLPCFSDEARREDHLIPVSPRQLHYPQSTKERDSFIARTFFNPPDFDARIIVESNGHLLVITLGDYFLDDLDLISSPEQPTPRLAILPATDGDTPSFSAAQTNHLETPSLVGSRASLQKYLFSVSGDPSAEDYETFQPCRTRRAVSAELDLIIRAVWLHFLKETRYIHAENVEYIFDGTTYTLSSGHEHMDGEMHRPSTPRLQALENAIDLLASVALVPEACPEEEMVLKEALMRAMRARSADGN